jgi:hypothetical protein
MKLETTLPERPGFLHAVPVVNLLLLLWFLHGSSPFLVPRSGVEVELPASMFSLTASGESLVITLATGVTGPQVYLGKERMEVDGLSAALDLRARAAGAAGSLVLLRSDGSVPVALERRISEMVLSKGYRLALVGDGEDGQKEDGAGGGP